MSNKCFMSSFVNGKSVRKFKSDFKEWWCSSYNEYTQMLMRLKAFEEKYFILFIPSTMLSRRVCWINKICYMIIMVAFNSVTSGIGNKSLRSFAILFSIFSHKRKNAGEIETNNYHHKSPIFYYNFHILVFIPFNLFFNFKEVNIQNVLCKNPILLKNTL